jgi:CRISPR-associated protein Csm3
MKSLTLSKIEELKGVITLKTGLHIGAGDVEMHIGGTDNPVIKHPFTNEPYIPGSSLKGKVRSLLELRSGLVHLTKGQPLSPKVLKADISEEQKQRAIQILKLFGSSGADSEDNLGPARISFSDCFFTEDVRQKIKEGEMVATEIKAENSIDRIKSTALNPRFTERVPAKLKFEFVITFKRFVEDEKETLEDALLQGLKLLELDALGGSGSRGYGKVKLTFLDESWQKKFEQTTPF